MSVWFMKSHSCELDVFRGKQHTDMYEQSFKLLLVNESSQTSPPPASYFFIVMFIYLQWPLYALSLSGLSCNCLALWLHLLTVCLCAGDFTQATGGASLVPAKPSPPMPPKRTTPVTKRNTEDPIHPIIPSPLSIEDHSLSMGFQLPPPPASPPLPTHRPPSPPRQQIHSHHLHHQHSYPHPLPQPIPMLFDPPSPTNDSTQRPAPVPLHIMIQRALSSPGPAQPHPDGSQRAHTLLFDTPPDYQAGRPLPVSIQPLKL